ncbi:MAG: type II/IV secretion system ATPase subunit [Methanocellales archaeon]|nr:type II/IV secretion system ATPase subunit [Methanocellales archaeon]
MAKKKKKGRKKAAEISRETLERLIAPKVEVSKRAKVSEEIETIWKKALKEGKMAKKGPIAPHAKVARVKTVERKPWLWRIRERISRRPVEETYDSKKHGPLVDLGMPKDVSYEAIDVYPVNEPYAYIRVACEPATHEHHYQVLEPKLSRSEQKLLEDIRTKLVEALDVDLRTLEEEGARLYLKNSTNKTLDEYRIELGPVSREKIMYYIMREFLGYGKIDAIMRDPGIEDISCDGPGIPIFVYHKKYESVKTNVIFEDEDELDSFIIKVAQVCGRHISIADPLMEGTLPGGSRVQLTLGKEITTKGSTFTVRKFRESPFTPPDLIDFNTFPVGAIAYLWLAVENNKSIIFAGGTASGKTSTLNAVALFIPPEMKIVSIEDTRELNLPHPNWIPGVTRETAGEVVGAIDMYELLRSALRQRPEFLILGEVRGKEAYVLFQAMATGHTTFSTMHADSVSSVVHRLENPPINIPRILLKSLDIISVQAQARVGGKRVRRMKTLTEIIGVDARTGELLTNEVFRWIPSSDEFEYTGRSYVLEDIMKEHSWDEKELMEELKRRQDILEWIRKKGITHYEDVAKIVVTYYGEPEKLMKTIRRDVRG